MPDDHYGGNKTEAEEAIETSGPDRTHPAYLRGAPVDIPKGASHNISTMFEMSANARIEFIHQEDVSTALCNAASCDGAAGKRLFLGGEPRCQLLGLQFASNIVAGSGIKSGLPAEAFKPSPVPEFYGDWVDMQEAQQLLDFLHHTMDALRAGYAQSHGQALLSLSVWPVVPPLLPESPLALH